MTPHDQNIICDYCKNPAEQVTGDVIYPHRPDLFSKLFWLCRPCSAYVGCHKGTTRPLGRLANLELRQWKQNAHAVFDPLWIDKVMTRKEAYTWLSKSMDMEFSFCHIGLFNVEQCKQVCRLVSQFRSRDTNM